MDVELIKALADLPIMGILIYLLVKEQGTNEKLLMSIIESEREHARNLVNIACHGLDISSVEKKVMSDN